jgi:hypothetical protein
MFKRTVSLWRRLVGRRGAAPANVRDDRASVRFPCDLESSCRPVRVERAPEWPAKVVNVSANGVGLVVTRVFAPGEVLCIELPRPTGEPCRTVLACVVHATRREDGRWLLGCSFAAELGGDDLRALGAERLEGAADEQRAFVRFPCDLEMTYRQHTDAEALPVRILNLSASGAGLLVSQPFEPGTLLTIALPRSGGPPLSALACVVSVQREDNGRWILGCNFSQDLSETAISSIRGTELR